MRRSVTVTLDTESAAFRAEHDEALVREVASDLLREAAGEILTGSDGGLLRDYNGNVVGSFTVAGER